MLARYLTRRLKRHASIIALLSFFLIVLEPIWHVRTSYRFDRPTENLDTPFFTECVVPLIESERTQRQSAVLFMLARNEDADDAAITVRNLENNFNQWYQYPWVFLNDKPWDRKVVAQISAEIKNGTAITFDTVDKLMWDWPDHFTDKDRQRAVRVWDKAVAGKSEEFRKGTKIQMESYHHMCRFNSGLFYDHPSMRQYKWYWRVEPGVSFTCDIPYDPFYHMAKRNKVYGYTIALWEVGWTSPSLFRATSDYAEGLRERLPDLWQAMHEPSWAPWPIRRLILPLFTSKNRFGDAWSSCHFWSNFEIADMDFFRSQQYRKYFDYLDKLGGFYYERWGDAPIHSLAAAMFLRPEQVHYFEDIGYKHPPLQHCPRDGLGCQCSCLQNHMANPYCLKSIRRTVEPARK